MKELSIEEKAKRYDEAYKKVAVRFGSNVADGIFLEESEDERIRKEIIAFLKEGKPYHCPNSIKRQEWAAWLEKQGEQKPADKNESRQEELTEFEKAVKQVMEEAIECGDTHNLKADADLLLRLVQKHAWSEEDIELLDNTIKFIEDRVAATSPSLRTYSPTLTGKEIPFLKALKDRVQPKQEWSEEDNRTCKAIIDNIQAICEEGYFVGNIDSDELIKWLKSIKERYTWRPSERQIYLLNWVANILLKDDGIVEKETAKELQQLLEQLKKL